MEQIENPNKLDKLKILGIESHSELPSEYIDLLYNSFKNNPVININECQIIENKTDKTKKIIVKGPKNNIANKKRVDDSDPKYQILLKLINNILTNSNRSTITKLTEFVDIDREDIIKSVNCKYLEKMTDEIFKYYDKMKAGWYRRKTTNGYVLSFLRYACRETGYDLVYIKKNHQKKGDVKTHLLYTIKINI